MSYLDLDFKTQIEPNSSKPLNKKRPPKFSLLIVFSILIILSAFAYKVMLTSDNNSNSESQALIIKNEEAISQSKNMVVTLKVPVKVDNSKKSIIQTNTDKNNNDFTTDTNKDTEIKTSEIIIPLKEQAEEQIPTNDLPEAITVVIKNGDSLSAIFNKQQIKPSVLYKIVSESEHGNLLKTIKSGQEFTFQLNSKGDLQTLIFKPDIIDSYTFSLNANNKYTSSFKTTPLDKVPTYREGVISSSLFLAAEKSQIPVNVIMNLVGIFAWDIDFALDIRKGDSFRLIYNELFQDGENIKTGKILAAEFINRGKVYSAFTFTDPTGKTNYYSSTGKSMRKAFLRNPVEFSRISSRFTNKRWHPVLSKWRSHKGVDYAAPRGTPIYAAGDGKVIHKGNKGGYGRTIVLEHGGKYTTLYAHLNSYNKKIRKGSRVKQGQIIGYVGSSGLATGPHLHYEFRVSGVHRNPLTVKLPAAQPINKKYKETFDKEKDHLLTMLNLMDQSSDP